MVASYRDVYLWQRQVRIYQWRLSSAPEVDPSFRRWRTENAIVKGWLINSMDPSLIANFIRFPTAKQV
jgi:hypothetical protein